MDMAGLGTVVKSYWQADSRMGGSALIGGQSVGVWYFDRDNNDTGFMGNRRFPSAHFEVIEGQPTTIHFQNRSPMNHTIHLHGLDVDQANDGVPQTSFSVPMMGTYDYEFMAPHAGTYHYHCHVDTIVHYHRGMAGAIIVRPADGATNKAWDGGPTFDEEVLWQMMTYDTAWAGINASGTATARHRPDVFMINGFDTPLATTDPYTRLVAAVGQRIYLRVINASYQWGRVRLAGLPFEVVASDGRPMKQSVTTDQWEIGPGERYDLLVTPTAPISADATVEYLDDWTGNVLGTAASRIEIA
jgi:FtsP/CotA-like multicopper oxidase with cupredoxin domain